MRELQSAMSILDKELEFEVRSREGSRPTPPPRAQTQVSGVGVTASRSSVALLKHWGGFSQQTRFHRFAFGLLGASAFAMVKPELNGPNASSVGS